MSRTERPENKHPSRPTPDGRPWLRYIEAYKGGVHKIPGYANPIILSSNENPYGCPPGAVSDAHNFLPQLNRYPEENHAGLRNSLATAYGLEESNIICGNGSDELLQLIAMAFAGPGDDVIYSEHGFLLYPLVARRVNARPVSVPERNLKTSVQAILDAVTPRTRIIYLANPNNPTGSYLTEEELAELCDQLDPSILLVVDAAYHEYARTVPDYPDALTFVASYPNLIVTRTFSKAFGLAGLRIGWAYGTQKTISLLRKVSAPFNVSAMAVWCAKRALLDTDFIDRCVAENHSCRAWFCQSLARLHMGLRLPPSVGNFQLLGFDRPDLARNVYDFAMSRGIVLRRIDAYGLADFLRVSIGTRKEMQDLLEVLHAFDDTRSDMN